MITITNKNIYFTDFSLSNIPSLSSLDNVERVHINNIINFLTEDVELGESVTFKRLFDIVSHNLNKFNEIFFSALGGHLLDPFLQEIENNPTDTIDSEYLEIHWFCDKYENELNLFPSIHGVSDKTKEVYAIDFVSLNNLKNYNVRLNRSIEILDYNEMKGKLKEVEENNIKTVYIGEKSFTLFDLYNAIFYEITFHGGPQDKKERFSELEETISKVEENMEEIEKTSKVVSLEEMIEEMDSKDEYLVKYKDMRERVEEERITKKKNLKKLKGCLLEKMKIYDIIENSEDNLKQYYKKLTDIEYSMQLLYGEEEDISYHRFWETPKCICPVIDNLEIFPSKTPIFNDKCPIHGKN